MKKMISMLIALIMLVSVMLSVPVSAYTGTEVNAVSESTENADTEEESLIMRIIHTIFFSKLTFDSNGGSNVHYQYAFKFFGKFKTPANPVKEGYTFDGWEPAIPARVPFKNVNVKAKWKTNTYSIKWMVDGSTYSMTELPYGVGITKPSNPVKEGYTFKGWEPAVAESVPAENLTYNARFTINSYNLTLKANGGLFADGKDTLKSSVNYNSVLKCEAPSREGYVFGGWKENLPERMPAGDIVLNATWVAKEDTKYTVEIYTMSVNGQYGTPQKKVFSGRTDSEVSFTPECEAGFCVDGMSVLSGIVNGDNSTVLKVYYARYKYLIKFNPDNGEPVTQQYYYYGATVNASEPSKDGYNFAGWDPAVTVATKNVTYTAQWKRATEYTQTSTTEEFYDECADLFNESISKPEFDAEEAKNDPYYMGRIIVGCDDYSLIDFDRFEATEVIFGEDGIVILQFDNRDDAEESADILRNLPGVSFVEADAYVAVPDDVETEELSSDSGSTWGEQYINADKYAFYLKNNNMDKPITVAVIDSGVDTDHQFLQNRIADGGINTADTDNKTNVEDDNGHGTHVAGIIKACTSSLSVNILPVKTSASFEDVNGNINHGSSIICIRNGIAYAAETDSKVINISMESPYGYISHYIEKTIDNAVAKGCVVVTAAGNGIDGEPVDTEGVCPAEMDNVIVVGALDRNGNKGDFSNYGDSVDVVAPGVDVISSYKDGKYAQASGSFQAAPHIAAAAAMFKLSHNDFTPAQIEEFIKQCCVDKGPEGRDEFYGEGCPDMNNAIPECTVSFNTGGGSAVAAETIKNSSSIVLPTPTKSFKVTLNANGGTLTQSSTTVPCAFGGWFTTSDFSGIKLNGGETYMLTEDQTLYAKWTNGQMGTITKPTRTTYSFAGWWTAASGGTEYKSSSVISSNITLYAHWTQNPLSDWTVSTSVPSGTTIEQSKKQYRYRDKQYTTSSNSTMSGWTKYDTKRTSWGSTVGPVYSNPSNGSRNVWSEQYVVSSNYKTVYRYWRYCKNADGTGGGQKTYSSTYKYRKEYVFDSPLTLKYTGDNSGGYRYYYNSSNPNTASGNYYVVWLVGEEQQWVSDNYGTRWYYQEPVYTYYYWKWGSWSAWQDAAVTETDTRDVDTPRTVCRYRVNADIGNY